MRRLKELINEAYQTLRDMDNVDSGENFNESG